MPLTVGTYLGIRTSSDNLKKKLVSSSLAKFPYKYATIFDFDTDHTSFLLSLSLVSVISAVTKKHGWRSCIVWHIKFTSFVLTFFWFCLGYGLVNDLASSISKYWSGVRGCWYITTIRVFQHLPQWYLAQRRYPRSTFFDLLYHHLNYSHQVRVDCFMG